MATRELPVISLFSGALGLDLGLERAGFRVRVAVECNRFAANTIRKNRPDIPVIERKLEKVKTEEILERARLKPGDVALVTGGPSCQAFSTAGQRGSVGDPRGKMFRQFLRVVRDIQPRFFVMENVRGVLSAAVRHRPLRERGPGYPPLGPDEELGSAFVLILRALRRTGYYTVFDLLNAADYGVPQTRERLLFIGSRDLEPVCMPEPTHAKEPTDGRAAWVTLRRAFEDLIDEVPAYKRLCPKKRKYLELIPEGGNWRDLPVDLQPEALGGAYVSWGGRGGFLRRLGWDRPAPALTSRPDSSATLFCHPTELRPLSVREGARLQQFPDNWDFNGGIPQQYVQVGNAVPLGLGEAVGRALRKTMRRRIRVPETTLVACENNSLVERIAGRPRTILNPPRMRAVQDAAAAKAWLGDGPQARAKILRLVTSPDR